MHRVNARTPWSKLYGDLWRHPKWLSLSKGARALWTSALSWVSETKSFGDIPAPMLAMWQGTAEEAAELVEVGLWKSTRDGWAMHDWNDHQTPEEKFKQTSERRAAAGRKGGKASALKRSVTSGDKQSATGLLSNGEATAKQARSNGEADIDVDVDVDELPPHSPPEGGGEDDGLFALEEPKPTRRKSGVYSDEFETAWLAFPKYGRQAKKTAAEAYDRALERADAATILAGIERYAAYVEQTDVKVKYMQGWLNADRWTDENAVQPYRNGFNRPTTAENVAAAKNVAAYWAQQEQQEVSAAGPNRRLSA